MAIVVLVGSCLFSPVAALLGDVNLSGSVGSTDLDLIKQALGATSSNPGFNPDADLDQSGRIDVADLAIAARSYGSTRNFTLARGFSNRGGISAYVGTRHGLAVDRDDQLHIVWSDGSGSGTMQGVYYTRLDRFGNTLVDDIMLDTNTYSGMRGVEVATDAEGNAHVVWDCGGGGYPSYARVDAWAT